jgi:hypothetical protein
LYLNPDSGSSVASAIASLQLTPLQSEALKTILDTVLTDTFYTMLLALDDETSLGENRHHTASRTPKATKSQITWSKPPGGIFTVSILDAA